MAEKKKFPSVPSNYVSILQLQERWIKQKKLEKEKQQQQQEQQRRREDEEEEEQTRLKQEQQRRREDDDKEEERKRLKQEQEGDQKNKRDGKRICEEPNVASPPSLKTRTPNNRRNIVAASRRRKPEETGKVKDEADVEAKPEQVVVVVGEVVRDGEGKTDDAKKKWRKKGKYRKEEVMIGDMEPATEVVVGEEKNIPSRRNSERKGKRSEWRSKSVNAVANGKVVEAKDDPTVEIGQKLEEVQLEQKFGELSVNRRKGEGRENARLRFERNGGGGGRRKEEAVVGDMEPVMEIVVVEEANVPARRNSERRGKRSEWQSKSKNAVANGKVVEAKDDPTVDIGEKLEEVELDQKFGELSVNRRKREGKEKARLRFERSGGGGRRVAAGRFCGGLERGIRRPRDGSLVWVKKEEVPDGKVA